MIKAVVGMDTYTAEDAKELIMQLKLEDWTTYNSRDEYKENMNKRVEIFTGERIVYRDDNEFLLELHRIGFFDSLCFIKKIY